MISTFYNMKWFTTVPVWEHLINGHNKNVQVRSGSESVRYLSGFRVPYPKVRTTDPKDPEQIFSKHWHESGSPFVSGPRPATSRQPPQWRCTRPCWTGSPCDIWRKNLCNKMTMLTLIRIANDENDIVLFKGRVADPHSFHPDPDPAF